MAEGTATRFESPRVNGLEASFHGIAQRLAAITTSDVQIWIGTFVLNSVTPDTCSVTR
jgi:hypothetical protein